MFDTAYLSIEKCLNNYITEKAKGWSLWGDWTEQVKQFQKEALPGLNERKNISELIMAVELFGGSLCSGYHKATGLGGSQLKEALDACLNKIRSEVVENNFQTPALDATDEPEPLVISLAPTSLAATGVPLCTPVDSDESLSPVSMASERVFIGSPRGESISSPMLPCAPPPSPAVGSLPSCSFVMPLESPPSLSPSPVSSVGAPLFMPSIPPSPVSVRGAQVSSQILNTMAFEAFSQGQKMQNFIKNEQICRGAVEEPSTEPSIRRRKSSPKSARI